MRSHKNKIKFGVWLRKLLCVNAFNENLLMKERKTETASNEKKNKEQRFEFDQIQI